MKIVRKDWERMLDLILTDNDGETVARSIKNKDKAIARFICGLKLEGLELTYSEGFRVRDEPYDGSFACFGNRAVELGAELEDIVEVFIHTEKPDFIVEKRKKYHGKKMNSMYVSFISKAIIDAGFDINYLNNGGFALTSLGRDAMERSGLKWTIGYKTEIQIGEEKYRFDFDAITCEGGGPTSYVVNGTSNNLFDSMSWTQLGKSSFKSRLLKHLKDAA